MIFTHCIIVLLFGLVPGLSEARTWQDAIDYNIYQQTLLDTSRHQLKVELDPFFLPEEMAIREVTPPLQPVTSTWVASSQAPTGQPSAIPSDMPSLVPTAPTAAPTPRSHNVEGHGGCQDGAVLYRVNMYDAWGDGWDSATQVSITGIEDQDTTEISENTLTRTHTTQDGDTTVSISKTVELTSEHPFGTYTFTTGSGTVVNPLGLIFEGSLQQGSHGDAYVCLVPKRCYEVVVHGGDYETEASWDIEPVLLASPDETAIPIVKGNAPSNCSFSIPDGNGEFFCAAACSSTLSSEQTLSPGSLLDRLVPIAPVVEEPVVQLSARSFRLDEGKKNGIKLLDASRNGES